MNRRIPLVVLALGALVVAGCSRPNDETAAAPAATGAARLTVTPAQRQRLRIETVRPTTFHETVETTGTVGFDADRATTVLAPISGPVSKLLVPLGAAVKAGDPLALVASADYATAIAGYRKAIVTARNLRRIADLDRKLFAADAIARRDVEQAETDAINAEADRDAALQQLRSIGVPEDTLRAIEENKPAKIDGGIIRSPLSGTLVERLVSPGQLLQAGVTPCFTVADLSRMWVMADVFESQLAHVAVGDSAEVHTSASPNPVSGRVDNIAAILDPNTRSIAVRIETANSGDVLKKGMYVRVVIRSHRATTGILVPVSAVLRDHENLPFVYLAQPDGSFARRSVNLGAQIGDRYEITAGLAAGARIVGDGGLYVQFQQNQ